MNSQSQISRILLPDTLRVLQEKLTQMKDRLRLHPSLVRDLQSDVRVIYSAYDQYGRGEDRVTRFHAFYTTFEEAEDRSDQLMLYPSQNRGVGEHLALILGGEVIFVRALVAAKQPFEDQEALRRISLGTDRLRENVTSTEDGYAAMLLDIVEGVVLSDWLKEGVQHQWAPHLELESTDSWLNATKRKRAAHTALALPVEDQWALLEVYSLPKYLVDEPRPRTERKTGKYYHKLCDRCPCICSEVKMPPERDPPGGLGGYDSGYWS